MRKDFMKRPFADRPFCSEADSLRNKIQSLEAELKTANTIIDKANKATTILVGSEYHNSPEAIITGLETLVRDYQSQMQKSILGEKTAKRELKTANTRIKELGAGLRDKGAENGEATL